MFEAHRAALRDRYDLQRVLGRGGMAHVYLGRRLSDEKRVAIKVLRPEFAVSLGADLFHREIAFLKDFEHPNILPLLESGEVESSLFYVMPYAEGGSLGDRLLRVQQLALDEACTVIRQVAAALDYAHGHNVVHRDIKPGNVLFQETQVLLCDFGVARAIIRSGGERLSSSGLLVGTPHYMSPEQGGGTSRLDGRSDIYSLGCVAYEALTGEPPFEGRSAGAILRKHTSAEPPSLRVVRPELPQHVEQAVHAALAKRPDDRPATAGRFAEMLEGR